MTVEFCYLIFIAADFYLINYRLVARFLLRGKYGLFVAMILGVIAVSSGLRALLAQTMNQHYFHPAALATFKTLYINSLVNISLWVSLLTLGKMITDKVRTQRQLELLEKERIKSELDYLKAQINPHAFFNSLNTIYGHIDKNNQVARNTLLQFSELLRYQLYDCGADKISLGEEVNYIKNYVHFQRLRKDDTLKVDFQVESFDSHLQIAPLLLVVLIENAFKFVSDYTDRENVIYIQMGTQGTKLFGTFRNTRELSSAFKPKNAKGIGISNLTRRLELLYKHKYELTMKMEDLFYETKLIIDLA